MNSGPFSLRRVWLIARMTALEAARQRAFHLVLLLAAGFVPGALAFSEFNFGTSELKFIADFGFGTLAIFGSILTVAVTTQLFFAELEHRTLLTLLAKPVWRGEFLLGKWVGIMAVVSAFCLLVTLLLLGVLHFRAQALLQEHPELSGPDPGLEHAAVAAAGIAQALKFGLLAAWTLLVASFARTQLYAVIVSFVVLLICHLHAVAHLAGARTDSWMIRSVAVTTTLIFPDFRLFELGERLGMAGAIDAALLGRILVYAGLNGAVVGALAVYSFSHREI